MTQKKAPIPPPTDIVFHGAIAHPELWLWDSWTDESDGQLHLFCLALSRYDMDGQPIAPGDRNDYPFHVRRFVSRNGGQSWTDKGAFLMPGDGAGGQYAHNVWSGSALRVGKDRLFGFTGIKAANGDSAFYQSICLLLVPAEDTSGKVNHGIVLSDPGRDYDDIRRSGYYLGSRDNLGTDEGEEGGPIMAWRDPFLFADTDGSLHLFWSAKIAPREPAIAHAILSDTDDGYRLAELRAPILLPDGDRFTQAEVPKIYKDEVRGSYYLLASTCNRVREGQPDSEVSKELRLYKSHSLDGPWHPYHDETSVVPDLDGLFGASIVQADFDSGDFTFIGPYTEMVAQTLQLTFAAPRVVNIFRPAPASGRRNAIR